MEVEELFKSKQRKGQIAKEWKEADRGKDPLIQYWKKRKRENNIASLEKYRSTH